MIRDRLRKLERLVTEAIAKCPGCVLIPARILMPGDLDPEPGETVRCARCGREHEPSVIRFVIPGFTGPFVATD